MSNETEKEEEKIKWHIDIVQTLVESYIEKMELERARNKAHTDVVENGLSSWRNTSLSGVTFAATVILALLTIAPEGFKDELIGSLIADLAIGLILFVAFTFVMNKAHNLVLDLNGWYFIASDTLADLNSLIIKETTEHIHEIEEEKIQFHWAYLAFASLAVRVYLIDIYEDIYKSKIFRKERIRWRRYRIQQKGSVVDAMDAYYTNPKSLLAVNRATGKYISDIVRYNRYIEEFFNYDPNRKRALVVERLDLDKLEKEVYERAKKIKPN